jgi:hypothetical protein
MSWYRRSLSERDTHCATCAVVGCLPRAGGVLTAPDVAWLGSAR